MMRSALNRMDAHSESTVMIVVIPVTLAIIFVLLYLTFRRLDEAFLKTLGERGDADGHRRAEGHPTPQSTHHLDRVILDLHPAAAPITALAAAESDDTSGAG